MVTFVALRDQTATTATGSSLQKLKNQEPCTNNEASSPMEVNGAAPNDVINSNSRAETMTDAIMEGLKSRKESKKPIARNNSDDCIEILDDDDDEDDVHIIEEPSPKRVRVDPMAMAMRTQRNNQPSPVPEDPKASEQPPVLTPSVTIDEDRTTNNRPVESHPTTSYTELLNRLEQYVRTAIDAKDNVDRKVLDALLAAINVQVQKEPHSVRKLILEKQLVLPNTISFPPSQVVDMVVEHDPDHQISRVISRLFGDERPKLTDTERKERQVMRLQHPAPNMTKLLMEIGQDLVQESTYYDIVHAKNLPEMPKHMETYKQVAAQLKPVWQALKAKNERHKLKVYNCKVCGFKTENKMVFDTHRQTLHFVGRRYQCTFCSEFDTNENRITCHIIEKHGVKPNQPEPVYNTVECPICEEDFQYKVQRDSHLKMCRRDLNKLRTIQMGRAPEDTNMINRWLWDKPPIEPSILNQQQQQQKQQQQQMLATLNMAKQRHLPQQQKSLMFQKQQILLRQQQMQQTLLLQQQKAALKTGTNNLQKRINGTTLASAPLLVGQKQQPSIGILSPQSAAAVAANWLPGSIANKLGNLPLNLQQQQQIKQQVAAMVAMTPEQRLKAFRLAAAKIAAPTTSNNNKSANANSETQQLNNSEQISVGDLVRMRNGKGNNVGSAKITQQVIQAVMQSEMLKAQKSQQLVQQIRNNIQMAGGSKTAATTTTTTNRYKNFSFSKFQSLQQAGGQGRLTRGKIAAAPPFISDGAGSFSSLAQSQSLLECEICDQKMESAIKYLCHLQIVHQQLLGKTSSDIVQGAPLACSRCKERFWTYPGLERHLVMGHGLVTNDLFGKAQRKADAGRCKLCTKKFAFNILQHLASDHAMKLCSAEIMYSCDVCAFKCKSYVELENHLNEEHRMVRNKNAATSAVDNSGAKKNNNTATAAATAR